MNSTLSTFKTMTEVPLSKAPNPQLLPGRVFTVCVCSLLTAVCVHLDGLNAEHQFRVWVTILDNTSLIIIIIICYARVSWVSCMKRQSKNAALKLKEVHSHLLACFSYSTARVASLSTQKSILCEWRLAIYLWSFTERVTRERLITCGWIVLFSLLLSLAYCQSV